MVDRRTNWLRTKHWDLAIEALDAERDAQEIVTLLANHVFPAQILVALELAQLRTFTIPTISRLLHATRQYEHAGQKRLDDTRAILTEIHESKQGSAEHREMVAHLNGIHANYAISNDDYLYTLSTFVVDPALFVERHGHRPFTAKEKHAFYVFYRRLGEAMKMRDIPESFDAFLAWRTAYEGRAQRFAPENEHVADGMLRAIAGVLPAPARPHVPGVVAAIIDEPAFLQAIGLERPSLLPDVAVQLLLRGYRLVSRFVNPFESARLWDHPLFTQYPTYPKGYERLRLGPDKVIARLDRMALEAKAS